jgi:hypothetical protein
LSEDGGGGGYGATLGIRPDYSDDYSFSFTRRLSVTMFFLISFFFPSLAIHYSSYYIIIIVISYPIHQAEKKNCPKPQGETVPFYFSHLHVFGPLHHQLGFRRI